MTAAQLTHLVELAAYASGFFYTTDPDAARMFAEPPYEPRLSPPSSGARKNTHATGPRYPVCEHRAQVRDDRARDTDPVQDALIFMEKWRALEQDECRDSQGLEGGAFFIENFGEVGRRGRIDPEVANGPCSARARSHHAEVHGGEDQLPANTYGLNESSTAIGAPVRGGDAGHSRSFDRRLAHQNRDLQSRPCRRGREGPGPEWNL